MTPTRMTSVPAAQRPPDPATAATSVAMDAAEAVLMKSLRVSSLSLLSVISSPLKIVRVPIRGQEGLLALEALAAQAVLEAEDARVALGVDVLEDVAVVHLARARLFPPRRIADVERRELVPTGV